MRKSYFKKPNVVAEKLLKCATGKSDWNCKLRLIRVNGLVYFNDIISLILHDRVPANIFVIKNMPNMPDWKRN